MLGVERTPTSSLEEVPEPQSINLLVYIVCRRCKTTQHPECLVVVTEEELWWFLHRLPALQHLESRGDKPVLGLPSWG